MTRPTSAESRVRRIADSSVPREVLCVPHTVGPGGVQYQICLVGISGRVCPASRDSPTLTGSRERKEVAVATQGAPLPPAFLDILGNLRRSQLRPREAPADGRLGRTNGGLVPSRKVVGG